MFVVDQTRAATLHDGLRRTQPILRATRLRGRQRARPAPLASGVGRDDGGRLRAGRPSQAGMGGRLEFYRILSTSKIIYVTFYIVRREKPIPIKLCRSEPWAAKGGSTLNGQGAER